MAWRARATVAESPLWGSLRTPRTRKGLERGDAYRAAITPLHAPAPPAGARLSSTACGPLELLGCSRGGGEARRPPGTAAHSASAKAPLHCR